LLEREMSAQWEALDPDLVLLGAVDPTLRNAYVGQWQAHRAVFGYVLLAEIPFRACNYIEDFAPDLQGLRFLVVDEYQDLNRADIKLLQLMAEQGVKLLAIGDDDQSIYGFRMAAPEGIAEFPATFRTANDYPLTVSMRCGGNVLEAATSLIETAPARVRRPRLSPVAGAPPGTFAYLRFPNQRREAVGVADLVARRIRDGVSAKDIAILVRSSVDSWAALLIPELQARGIDVVDTDWVARGMQDPSLRRALAVARIAVERSDSLAWWTLLHLTRGIAEEFIEQIATQCGRGETFGSCLLRTAPTFGGLGSRQSVGTAAKLIREQLTAVEALDIAGTPTAPGGWGTWLANRVVHGALSDDASRLLKLVGAAVPAEDGLASFLGQLEPVGKDVALQADAVRIMSMSSSKGLTVNSAFVMGVEAGIMPHPTADPHEERRLLYVAMTRATTNCVLTAAARRTGPTARHGTPNVNQPRGRCPLFDGIIGSGWQSGEDFVTSALSAGDN
jgi:DNA helicase-2/ATP-dependent DNA helicase PcrA